MASNTYDFQRRFRTINHGGTPAAAHGMEREVVAALVGREEMRLIYLRQRNFDLLANVMGGIEDERRMEPFFLDLAPSCEWFVPKEVPIDMSDLTAYASRLPKAFTLIELIIVFPVVGLLQSPQSLNSPAACGSTRFSRDSSIRLHQITRCRPN